MTQYNGYSNVMEGKFGIVWSKNSSLESDLNVIHRSGSNLESSINIRENAVMEGMYELQFPPTYSGTYKPIEDTTIRAAVRTFNYGTLPVMYVGDYRGKEDRALIRFDISNIKNESDGVIIQKASLILNYERIPKDLKNLQIYSLNETFYEYGTTEASFKNNYELFKTVESINSSERSIKVDITPLVMDWLKHPEQNKGIALKFEEFIGQSINIYSSEHNLSPILEVEYFDLYDPSMRETKRSNLKSELTIREEKYNDLLCSINLVSKFKNKDLESSINIENDRYLPANLVVNNRTLFGSLNVRKHSSLQCSLFIAETAIADTESELVVSQPRLLSDITVRRTEASNIDSNVTVKRREESQVVSHVNISKPFVAGSIYVKAVSQLESSLTVLKQDESEIAGAVYINRPLIEGSLHARAISEMVSSITIARPGEYDTRAKLYVNRPLIEGSLTVRDKHDLEATLTPRVKRENSLLSHIGVSYPNMPSHINVRQYEDLESSMFVVYKKEEDLDSSITVKVKALNDFEASMKNRASSSVPSEITVSNPFISAHLSVNVCRELDTEASISVRAASEIGSSLHVRAVSTLESNLVIQQMWFDEMESFMTVKRKGVSDIASRMLVLNPDMYSHLYARNGKVSSIWGHLYIRERSDLDSSLAVKVNGKEDLHSSINVVYKDCSELESTLKVGGPLVFDIEAELTIRDRSDKESSITVKVKRDENLESSLTVKRKERFDIEAELKVRKLNSYVFIM